MKTYKTSQPLMLIKLNNNDRISKSKYNNTLVYKYTQSCLLNVPLNDFPAHKQLTLFNES